MRASVRASVRACVCVLGVGFGERDRIEKGNKYYKEEEKGDDKIKK